MRPLLAACVCAACGDAMLIVDPMGADQCAAHCAETIEIDLAGAITSAPCGEPIVLERVPTGEQVRLRITVKGQSADLVGEADVMVGDQDVEVSVPLEPVARPRIDRIEPDGTILYGPTEIEIIGQGFGDRGGEAGAAVGAVALEILEWRDDRILAITSTIGDLVITECGVDSSPVRTPLRAIVPEILKPFPAPCSRARLVSSVFGPMPGLAEGIASCGACENGLLFHIDPMSGTIDPFYGPTPGCPVDLAPVDGGYDVATTDGLFECEAAGAPPNVTCTRVVSDRVLDVTRVGQSAVAYVREPSPNGPRELWLDSTNPPDRVLENQLSDVVAVDAFLVLGRNRTGTAVVLEWDRRQMMTTVTSTMVLDGCATPRALRVHRPNNGERRIVVICEDAGGLQILSAGELTPLPGLSLVDALIDLDGALLWLWSGDALHFFDLSERVLIGTLPLPPRYPNARLLRASNRNRFLLGGPEPGQLTRLDIE